jgi:hypothetical protein
LAPGKKDPVVISVIFPVIFAENKNWLNEKIKPILDNEVILIMLSLFGYDYY